MLDERGNVHSALSRSLFLADLIFPCMSARAKGYGNV